MKKLILLSFIVTAMLALTGCGDKRVRITPPCFVLSYAALDSLAVTPADSCHDPARPFVIVEQHSAWERSTIDYSSEKRADNSWFLERYSAKYGDLSFNEEITYFARADCRHGPYVTPDIASLSVVSSSDYDAAHPAGAELRDIIRYSGVSLYPFIKNGYSAPGSLDGYATECQADTIVADYIRSLDRRWDYGGCISPVFKRIDQLTETDLYLNGTNTFGAAGHIPPFFCLTFMSLPDSRTVHDFTLTAHGSDGKEYTARFSLDFSAAE